MKLRFATPEDSRALLEIYARYIETPITFEYALPTTRQFSERISGIIKDYPYLVCEHAGIPIGYACAHRHMERQAYQWNVELSVCIQPEFTAKGIGKQLYGALLRIVTLQGAKTAYGGVTLPNPGSEALHRALGFTAIGVYHNAGYKNGRWHNVAWFEKQLSRYTLDPAPLIAVRDIPDTQIQKIFSAFG